jgi:hypothetical protein
MWPLATGRSACNLIPKQRRFVSAAQLVRDIFARSLTMLPGAVQ